MEYIPLAVLLAVCVLARKLRSFKVEIDFNNDDSPHVGESVSRGLPPGGERRLLKEGRRRRGRR